MAAARFFGSPDLKIPEPTNTPSAPNCIIRAASAGVVKAVTNYTDQKMLAELSEDLGEAMVGINEQEIKLLMAERGK